MATSTTHATPITVTTTAPAAPPLIPPLLSGVAHALSTTLSALAIDKGNGALAVFAPAAGLGWKNSNADGEKDMGLSNASP